MSEQPHGWTVPELAKMLRVSEDKVRGWIRRGELAALNTAAPLAKPRFVVLPHHLTEFEQRHRAAPPPQTRRRRTRSATPDYFPD